MRRRARPVAHRPFGASRLRGLRPHHPHLTIHHIDAHRDIYHAYQGNPRSHTSPFARIMEEKLADRLIQVGLRTVNDHHRNQFKRFGVETIEAIEHAAPLQLDITAPVCLSVDIDVLDPAFRARRFAPRARWLLDPRRPRHHPPRRAADHWRRHRRVQPALRTWPASPALVTAKIAKESPA